MNVLVTGGRVISAATPAWNCFKQVILSPSSTTSRTASTKSLRRVQEITGKSLAFHQVDLLDCHALDRIFDRRPIDAVIHFAALKAAGESVMSTAALLPQ